ncbi:unnamed protein product [Symbiodinium sp. CCMP2592]|nr:unnamed protein product [Symbiodinium sp. CCMP2592]
MDCWSKKIPQIPLRTCSRIEDRCQAAECKSELGEERLAAELIVVNSEQPIALVAQGLMVPVGGRVRGPNRHPPAATSEWWGWWDWDSDWSSQWDWRTSQQEEASSSQAPKGAKGSGAAEAPTRPRRPLIGERTEAPNQNRGRTAEPEKGKGKTGPSAGRPAAAQPAKGKAAQAKGAEQPAKGRPAPAGKSGKGKPATQEPEQGSGKKKNHRGGRSHEARGAERREREGTDPVVLVEGPGTDIPEPRTPEQAPAGAGQGSESSLDTAPVPKAPVFTGPVPGEDTPDFGGSNSEGERETPPAAAPASSSGGVTPAKKEEPAERVAPPASAKAAAEPAEEAKPEASPKAAPKAAEAKEESSGSPSSEAGQEQAAPAEPKVPRGAPAAKAPTVKAPPPHLGPPPPLKEEPKAAQPGPAEPEAAVPPAPREEAPKEELEPTSPADEGEEEESEEESSEGQGPCQFLNGLRHAARNRPETPWEGNPRLAEQYGEALVLLDEISQAIFDASRDAAIGELSAQRQQGLAAAAATAAVATAAPGRDDWERFAFQAESYLAAPLQMAAMTEEVRTLSVRLFGMLGSWTQDSATAVKLARGVKGQNGFELWRLLWQEHNPENESKNLTWRRTLLMPKFPPKESDFSLALQEWEADVDRYASEYGAGRALADEDLRAVLVTESPNALRQHLAMHAASLSTYAEVREVVVSYLQAKRVWTPSAGYAASSRRDPNAMDIGRIGDRDGKEGKGKGDKGKKGDKDHRKGKGDHDNKGKGKRDKKGNQQGGRDGKERCPICWKTGHTVKECWFNAKGKGKGTKGQVAQVADDAATTVSTASLATAGPSASQAGGSTGGSGGKGQVRQVRDDRILGVRFAPPHDTEPEEDKILKVSGSLLVDSGACVSVCRPEAFPDLQPAGPPKSLYSVDNSRLKTKGRVQPNLLLGEERQSCKVNFEVTEDIEDEILSISRAVEAGAGIWLHREDSHILWPDGVRRDLGHYDYIPEHDLEAREVEDAAMEAAADEEAEAAEEEEAAGTRRARAREDPHRRREPSDDPVTPLVTMDYQFYSRDGKEVEEEASLATVLNLTDRATGWTLSVPVAHKGHRHAAYAAGLVEQFVDRLGYDKFTLQADQENAIASVARAVHRRHVAWLQARFGTKSTDGVTPYRAATGTDYGGALCALGQKRDDSHVVLTEAGNGAARTARRALAPSDVEAGPSAASALPQQAASPAPAANDGSGEGGQKRDSAGSSASAAAAQQPPAAKSRVECKKAPRLGALTEREVWQHIADPPLTNHKGERDAWVGQVTDLLDRMLYPKQVEQARKEQLRKLWDRGAFTPVLRSEVPRGAQLFRAKWVDKCDKGRYKSRCTCADVKARYSPEQEAGLDVFVPTPTPESHSLLEVAALHNEGWVTRSLDIVAAFLIGKDRGAAEGRPVYMYAPVEWRELFDQWVLEQPAKDQQWYRDHFRDFVFRVDGNLYGRRTAGSVYRDELEEVLTGKLAKDYDFQRGVKDPRVYLDRRSGLILLHHIDDIRVAGPKAVLKFTEVDLPTHCEITVGELEEPGTAVEVLGRTKVRTEDSILTLPDSKHAENVCEQLGIGPKDKGTVPSRPLDLTKVEELSASDAARFRSAAGSAIYLSADRRDIQFAVKELARRMQNPRVCDWLAAETLARYLRATPRFGRVVVLDPASKSTALLNLEVYSDSDWAGCPETRRSTDNIVACLGGAVIQTSCQTQPGLPATSSGDAEIRGVSRAAREAVFLRELAEKDFALVRQSLPSMGMVDLDAVAGATEALAQKGTIKSIQASPWKMRPPTKPASSALMATIVALQVRPAKAQGHDFAELVLGFAALGFLAFLWMLWGLVSWLCRCRRDRQEPEPEEEIEHHAERAVEPPRAAQRATEVWLGPEAPQEAQEERSAACGSSSTTAARCTKGAAQA